MNLFGGGDIKRPKAGGISPGMKGAGGMNGRGAPGMNPCGRKGGIIIGAGGKPLALFGDSTRIGEGIEFIVSLTIPDIPSKSKNFCRIYNFVSQNPI